MGRAVRKLREVGPLYAVQLALARFVPVGWLRIGRLVVLELDAGRASEPETASAESFRWADQRDLELLGAFGHGRDELLSRLTRGDHVFVATSGDTLLGYAWFRRNEYDEESVGIRFTLGPEERWLYDAMVASESRGRGIYARLLRAAAVALQREGVARIWIAIEARNRNSLAAHERGGAHRVCDFRLWRILGVGLLLGSLPGGVARWSIGRWPQIPSSALRPGAGPSGS
jgi:GNAT superfamily N-acetyltransferase